MGERFNPPVLKTGAHFVGREFKSRPLRHYFKLSRWVEMKVEERYTCAGSNARGHRHENHYYAMEGAAGTLIEGNLPRIGQGATASSSVTTFLGLPLAAGIRCNTAYLRIARTPMTFSPVSALSANINETVTRE